MKQKIVTVSFVIALLNPSLGMTNSIWVGKHISSHQNFPFHDEVKTEKQALKRNGIKIIDCKIIPESSCAAEGCSGMGLLYFSIDAKYEKKALKQQFLKMENQTPDLETASNCST